MGSELHPDPSRFVDLVDGRLDAAARRHIEDHLLDCASCRAEVAALRDDVDAGEQALPWDRLAFATLDPAEEAGPLAAAAAGEDTLPDPEAGRFLARFDEADLEVYAHRAADGWHLAIYCADGALVEGVHAPALVTGRRFATGWVGPLALSGTAPVRIAIRYGGDLYEVDLLGGAGPARLE